MKWLYIILALVAVSVGACQRARPAAPYWQPATDSGPNGDASAPASVD